MNLDLDLGLHSDIILLFSLLCWYFAFLAYPFSFGAYATLFGCMVRLLVNTDNHMGH